MSVAGDACDGVGHGRIENKIEISYFNSAFNLEMKANFIIVRKYEINHYVLKMFEIGTTYVMGCRVRNRPINTMKNVLENRWVLEFRYPIRFSAEKEIFRGNMRELIQSNNIEERGRPTRDLKRSVFPKGRTACSTLS